MSRSSGPGRPITLRCGKCKRTEGRGYDLEATGLTGKLVGRQRGTGGSRVMQQRVQYRCLGCGHVGWTRHVDGARLLRSLLSESSTTPG